MGERREYKLGDLVDVAQGLAINAKTNHLLVENGLPLLRITDLLNNKVSQFIDGDKVPKQCIAKPDDIIYTRTGQVGFVFRRKAGVIHNNSFKVIPNSLIDKDYLFWFLNSPSTKELAINSASGSVQLDLTHSAFKNIPIALPLSLQEQNAIASIFNSLDDKIDLLHRQNKTLEALAETLFRQWFVEEAEEGWETGKLGDVIELVYGKGLKEEIRTGRGFPVVGSSGVVGYHSDFLVEGPGIVIGRKGTLGKVIYLFENFFPIDTTYFIKSKVNSVGLFYEYFLLKTLNFEDMNTDSAVPGLNRELALSTEIKIAPFNKLKQYNVNCASLFEKLKQNNSQIRTLTRLRDTLLPKLMSGEVRVKN